MFTLGYRLEVNLCVILILAFPKTVLITMSQLWLTNNSSKSSKYSTLYTKLALQVEMTCLCRTPAIDGTDAPLTQVMFVFLFEKLAWAPCSGYEHNCIILIIIFL